METKIGLIPITGVGKVATLLPAKPLGYWLQRTIVLVAAWAFSAAFVGIALLVLRFVALD